MQTFDGLLLQVNSTPTSLIEGSQLWTHLIYSVFDQNSDSLNGNYERIIE